MQLTPDSAIRRVTLEIESHVAQDGWDQQPRLYALVPTDDLLAQEPGIADQMDIDPDAAQGSYTPIEQEELPPDRSLEDVLHSITWPEQVAGCAAVVERLMLPPDAERDLPDHPDEIAEFAASHPDRQEVRMAVSVTRDGDRHCAIRVHSSTADDADLVEGPDLVPALVVLLEQTLAD